MKVEPGVLAWRYCHGREAVYIEEYAKWKDKDDLSLWAWLLEPPSEELAEGPVLTWVSSCQLMTPTEQLAWIDKIPEKAK
jgi:hypothetical protein